jgi:hypothetical protein
VNARFEIWFLSDDRISVLLETDQETGPIHLRELFEITTVAALAAGVIANLPKDLAKPLCIQLADFSAPATQEDIPSRVGDLVLVLPGTERGRKGFDGTLKMKGDLPVARWKPRGFRLFGREVQDYSQTATMAVLLHVIGGLSSNGRAILAETARTLGRLGLTGGIGMLNHGSVAMTAVEQAVEAETERNEGDEKIPSSSS